MSRHHAVISYFFSLLNGNTYLYSIVIRIFQRQIGRKMRILQPEPEKHSSYKNRECIPRKQQEETIQRLSILEWLNILVLLFYSFVKERKSQASCFPIRPHIFSRIDLRKENESSLFRGKFPFQRH